MERGKRDLGIQIIEYYDITEKEGITTLNANTEFKHTHSITIL